MTQLGRIEWFVWFIITLLVTLQVWPAAYWYDGGQMHVEDAGEGEDHVLISSGSVLRPFQGSYNVTVRDASTREVVGENPSNVFPYEVGSVRPDPLLLYGYWGPNLAPLPVGSFVMQTCWTVHGAFYGLTWPKSTCVTSNIFVVTENEHKLQDVIEEDTPQ